MPGSPFKSPARPSIPRRSSTPKRPRVSKPTNPRGLADAGAGYPSSVPGFPSPSVRVTSKNTSKSAMPRAKQGASLQTPGRTG